MIERCIKFIKTICYRTHFLTYMFFCVDTLLSHCRIHLRNVSACPFLVKLKYKLWEMKKSNANKIWKFLKIKKIILKIDYQRYKLMICYFRCNWNNFNILFTPHLMHLNVQNNHKRYILSVILCVPETISTKNTWLYIKD